MKRERKPKPVDCPGTRRWLIKQMDVSENVVYVELPFEEGTWWLTSGWNGVRWGTMFSDKPKCLPWWIWGKIVPVCVFASRHTFHVDPWNPLTKSHVSIVKKQTTNSIVQNAVLNETKTCQNYRTRRRASYNQITLNLFLSKITLAITVVCVYIIMYTKVNIYI